MNYLQLQYGAFLSICILLSSLAMSSVAFAAKWDSPKKTDENDIVVPVKNTKTGESWSVVMRKMTVPGKEFWLSTERFIELGESGSAGVYERPVSVNVKGSVKTNGEWTIWVGKYETTVGQFAAVMGDGDMSKGLDLYIQYSNRDKSEWDSIRNDEKKLKSAFAKPADRIPPVYVQLFIRQLNQLCLVDTECRNSLPAIDADSTISGEKYLPFFRLPTEVEWEYAARGVSVKRSKYRDRLPVSSGKIKDYAVLDKLSSIGRRKPIFGFYDMFGNVSELVSGRMTPEIGGIGTGSWLAKGGKAAGSASKKPYSSQREEILEFEWRAEDDQPRAGFFNRVGFRLALGVPLQAFDKLAANERSVGSESSADPDVSTDISEQPINDVESVMDKLNDRTGVLGPDQQSSLGRQLASALERLKKDELTRNTRMAKFIADNTFIKLVRVWSLRNRIEKQKVFVKEISPDTEKAKRKIASWREQIEFDLEQTKILLQEYEEGVSAVASVPNIDASITGTINLSGYQQSDGQIVLAETAVKLLSSHIKKKNAGTPFDFRKEIDAAYPL